MNIRVCDLCRREMGDSPITSITLSLQSPTPKHFTVEDVCERCMDLVTAFLDGLREGPPGASLMLPKEETNDGTAG